MSVFPVNHVWFFLTDLCNLHCGHCFFRYKTGCRTLSPRIFDRVLAYAMTLQKPEFILSGGEPLMAWEYVRKMVLAIRRRMPSNYISIQSNLILLDQKKADFLKQYKVNVEVGIDGDEKTTLKNRPGIGGSYYEKVCQGIQLLKNEGVSMTATMTVYPDGVKRLFSNFMFLHDLGLTSIEIHPAFLAPWRPVTADIFLKAYREVSAYELRHKDSGLIGRGYSFPVQGAFDLVVLPDGKVLPNWVFLSFPERIRKKFFIMDFNGSGYQGGGRFRLYLDALKIFLAKKQRSYREVSNFNAKLAMRGIMGGQRVCFEEYECLCERIEKIDLKFLEKTECF